MRVPDLDVLKCETDLLPKFLGRRPPAQIQLWHPGLISLFSCSSKCLLCWNESVPVWVPSSPIYTCGYQLQWGFNAWVSVAGCGVGGVTRSLICKAGREKSNPQAGGIQANNSVIPFSGLCHAVLPLQPQGSSGCAAASLLVGT